MQLLPSGETIILKSPPPGPYIQLETNFAPVESSFSAKLIYLLHYVVCL